jgi:hypothetical protein
MIFSGIFSGSTHLIGKNNQSDSWEMQNKGEINELQNNAEI